MSETWVIRENPSDIDILYITTEEARYGEEIAVIYSGNMEHAHLIKAAPKMRDALESLLEGIPYLYEAWRDADKTNGVSAYREWNAAKAEAQAALAEANGETE